MFDFGLKIHVIYSSQDKTTLAKSWIDSKNDNCLEGFQYFDNFFLNRLHRVMVVSTRLEATKTEIIDVINGETCSDIADFKMIYGPVGANLQGIPVWVPGALKKSNNTEFLRLLGQWMATKDKYPEL